MSPQEQLVMADDEHVGDPEQFSGEFQHTPVTARVPEQVANGVFANGVVVLAGPHEIVCDFVLRLTPPHRVVGRVILSFGVAHQFVQALKQNMEMYQDNFGELPHIPTPRQNLKSPLEEQDQEDLLLKDKPTATNAGHSGGKQGNSGANHQSHPGINEVYEEMKINEPELGGHYSNAVLIRHTPTEYCFDFIANIFPKSVVTLRLIMPVPHIPSFYHSLHGAIQQRK